MVSSTDLPPWYAVSHAPGDLLTLVRRIATEDRDAFAVLCDVLSPGLTRHLLLTTLTQPLDGALVSATLVEVWWLARFHVASGTDVLAWVSSIICRRVEERERSGAREPGDDPFGAAADLPDNRLWIIAGAERYYRCADLTLAELLRQP